MSVQRNISDFKVSKDFFGIEIRLKVLTEKLFNKTIENINEKLFLVMIIFYKNYLTDYHEEIFQIKLSNDLLENVKAEVLRSYTVESKSFLKEENNYHKLAPNLLSEIKELKKTHASSLNEEEKKVFLNKFSIIRLPNLLEERKLIEKQIKNLLKKKYLKTY